MAPFKAQNMSNNAAVCANGGEIGRSQALQALAAGAEPIPDMNPILLKPEGDCRSQVIVQGFPWRTGTESSLEAREYFQQRQQLWPYVTESLERLRATNDVIVIEGAGSPAELNLNKCELVNMAIAKYLQAPVVLIGDIERGGVFAQLLGTLSLLEPEERALVQGILVNKFRGDIRLFDDGVRILEERSGLKVWGVLPWMKDLNLPDEDALALSDAPGVSDVVDAHKGKVLRIAIVHLPHIANFDDFDPLRGESFVRVSYVRTAEQLRGSEPWDVIILPGTKNTLSDLRWLRQNGIDETIRAIHRSGQTEIVGICGGYQILGGSIDNPHRLESNVERERGLELLPISTTFHQNKSTYQQNARVLDDRIAPGTAGLILSGYEIHSGQTISASPWLEGIPTTIGAYSEDIKSLDGSISSDGRVWGCYLHGIFGNDRFRNSWLDRLYRNRFEQSLPESGKPVHSFAMQLQRELDRLADHFETLVDWRCVENLLEFDQNKNIEGYPLIKVGILLKLFALNLTCSSDL